MAPAASPADVARTLRRARKRRGVSLSDATAATMIDARYLEALENDAPIEDFPAPAYARFFLKEYARFLSLDDGELVRAFELAHPLPNDELPSLRAKLTPIERRPWPFTRALVTILSVLALVAIAVASFVASADRGGEAAPLGDVPAAAPSSAPSPVPSAAGGGAEGERPAKPDELAVSIAITERSWVQATVDGRARPGRTMEEGDRIRLKADRIVELRLGNAGGVRLRINGRAVRTGDPGEVVTLSFRLTRDGRIIRG